MILAAGEQKRWIEDVIYEDIPYKHLLKIDNEILIYRTMRQFDFKVAACDNLAKFLPKEKTRIMQCGGSITDRILELIDESNLFILGDVYFTDAAVKKINEVNRDIVFFGSYNQGEIFAFKFNPEKRDIVRLLLKSVAGDRRLWDVYYKLTGHHDSSGVLKNDYFVRIEDATQDFDTQYSYWKFLQPKPRTRFE